MEAEVANLMQLSDDDISEIQYGSRTKYNYNMAWSRTYLKGTGYLQNSDRGIWTLTSKVNMDTLIDPDNILSEFRRIRGGQESQDHGETQENQISGELIWQEELLEIVKNISPGAFERLCQRLLREAGFINVKVTGQSGDGGIDRTGVLKINRLVSFHVYF